MPVPTVVMEQIYPREEPRSALFWNVKNQTPSDALADVLRLMHIPVTLPLDQLIEHTQKEWLRTKERAMTVDSPELQAIQPQILRYAEKLHMRSTIEPRKVHFSEALVLGSKLRVVEKRLHSVLERKGIAVEMITILSGERKLDQDEIDALAQMGCEATDEREMMEFIAKKTVQDIPLKFVKAAKKKGATRATTEDTVREWLAGYQPSAYPVLLTSSQPYGLYQLLIAKRVLPATLEVDLLAVETAEARASIYLDTLARILFLISL